MDRRLRIHVPAGLEVELQALAIFLALEVARLVAVGGAFQFLPALADGLALNPLSLLVWRKGVEDLAGQHQHGKKGHRQDDEPAHDLDVVRSFFGGGCGHDVRQKGYAFQGSSEELAAGRARSALWTSALPAFSRGVLISTGTRRAPLKRLLQ